MAGDRVTVSLDEKSRAALDELVSETGKGQSEAVRQAVIFYAANFKVANSETNVSLEQYHQMLNAGEHVLLDIDFLHGLLEHAEKEDGEPNPAFQETIDRVAEFHAEEYRSRFDTLSDMLDWLSFCGFLSARKAEGETYHVVFPTEKVKWFMTEFIDRSTEKLDFDVEISEGVSKAIISEV
ncbi:ribbon-helix-helix protein, CopG family [Halovenus salina]|uniref:Ribbon-helix-helix protein, CopG family n=1 Tax=Halovenus salina TaxID=1510225 RepID=A0ABD5W1F0_9EURY|nr:ribbon-helix-helix protein, CopG family [Halovenus salina]